MDFVLKSYTYPVLIFLLEVLVYLENLWYEAIWSCWQPSHTTTLDKLIMQKEDEIWHAVIYGNDRDVRKIFEDLTNTPEERRTPSYSASDNGGVALSSSNPRAAPTSGEIEAGVSFHRPKTEIQKAVETDIEHEVLRGSRSRIKGDYEIVRYILEKSLSASPDTYINARDNASRTALHVLVYGSIIPLTNPPIELDNALKVFGLLLEHGASIDALDELFRTPLHLLFYEALFWKDLTEFNRQHIFLIPLLDSFLLAGAEVQTKDADGNTPLHVACELQNHKAIEKLILNGADPETLNRDGKTPRRVFLDSTEPDKDFWERMTALSRQKQSISAEVYAPSRKPSQSYERITKARMAFATNLQSIVVIKEMIPILRPAILCFGRRGTFLYPMFFIPRVRQQTLHFFQQTREVDHTAEDGFEKESVAGRSRAVDRSVPSAENAWVWVNFPANNATWIRLFNNKTFIENNFSVDASTWRFYEKNMKLHASKGNGLRIRTPHAYKMSKVTAKSSKHDDGKNTQTEPMVSLAIPFIDIEVQPWGPSRATPGEEAYPPFTGLDGVQKPQTLDQTSFNAESLSKMRSKENQVIYRWSEKQGSAQLGQLPLEWSVIDPFSKLASLLDEMRHRAKRYERKEARSSSLGRTGRAGGGEGADYSARMQSIRKERCPKWLMVRQLWLWKLNDGTVLTAIPSRRTMCMADELLEVIRESNLHGVSSGDELMKHVVKETITFPNKFMRAGLGEHILNIFEGEIASEADEEATFYNNFTQNDWDSKHANKAINCTWRVKDIRDELGLIEKVFSSQLEVVKQFAKVLTPLQAKTTSDPDYIRTLVAELEGMIKRIKSMDNDAAATLESLNNITQAMLAQASLKEAESARLMNFIILPFTIVTVIFMVSRIMEKGNFAYLQTGSGGGWLSASLGPLSRFLSLSCSYITYVGVRKTFPETNLADKEQLA
ncbi:ankyrin repeat [Fusarium pseudocircinatum]|uniref:Ankyrin repeat n=1 Tax=Fusarium pseudocircinatum TaxID=56676 RepID=A0A8H5KPL1_9HYPO|nr:ankyrin repeat [Fusarium pseudocircinatum]